jgi:hypothetical protein
MDPTAWTQEQQEQFMRALMGARLGVTTTSNPAALLGDTTPPAATDNTLSPDPLTALMSSMMSPSPGPLPSLNEVLSPFSAVADDVPSTLPGVTVPQPIQSRSFLQRLLPLFHLVLTFVLLGFFVLQSSSALSNAWVADSETESLTRWSYWADLRLRKQDISTARGVPFFAAFITLELILQSARILGGLDDVRPPVVVQMALLSLPQPIPSLIMNCYKYSQILGVLLDDIAGVIVGIGFSVWLANMISA